MSCRVSLRKERMAGTESVDHSRTSAHLHCMPQCPTDGHELSLRGRAAVRHPKGGSVSLTHEGFPYSPRLVIYGAVGIVYDGLGACRVQFPLPGLPRQPMGC